MNVSASRYAVTARGKENGGLGIFLCRIIYNVTRDRKMRTIRKDGVSIEVKITLRVAGTLLDLVSPQMRYLARVEYVLCSLACLCLCEYDVVGRESAHRPTSANSNCE